ncbi:MAG: FHA domain-containing protein [Motiliproteus sp.]
MNSPTLLSLCLEPISHPDLGDILVDGCLVAIGRMESPFAEHPNDAVSKLSRRHARIFQEQGHFYLTDLASRNGTTLNDERVSQKPVPLTDTDIIGFADIRYRVAIRVHEPLLETAPKEPLRLMLVPLAMAGCNPIVISQFPFLVSKSDGVFSQHPDMFKDSLNYISRRHAHLYLVDDALFIEDLSSTNGTFVNGDRLEEHARQLQDGDILAFGNPDSCFRAEVKLPHNILIHTTETEVVAAIKAWREAEEVTSVTENLAPILAGSERAPAPESDSSADPVVGSEAAPAQEVEIEHGTILVDKASPFLDIFYDKGAEETDVGADDAVKLATDPARAENDSPSRRKMHKIGVFWSELKGALREEPGTKSRMPVVLGGLGALVLVLGGGLMIYQRGAPERQINALLEQGDYAAGAALATRYLGEQPENEAIGLLAKSAILKQLMPGWQQQIEEGNFDRAAALIAQARSLTLTNSEVSALMDLVEWMTRLERFVQRQTGENALVIYRDEATLQGLTDQWQGDATGNRLRLGGILRVVPNFKTLHAEVMSHLRLLQSYETVYLKASDALKQEIIDLLTQGQLQPLQARIRSFQQKYPKVGGTERLQADLDDYIRLQHQLDQRHLVALLRQWRQTTLRTPPFQRHAAEHIASVLPPETVANSYFDSVAAWRAGNAQQAITLLEPLAELPWGDVATATIDRYQQIHQGYEALASLQQQPDYPDQLVRFYRQLHQDTDGYYLQILQPAFSEARDKLLKRAESQFVETERYWLAYRSAGGITGLLRLEESVSKSFRQRATELSKALQYLMLGSGHYQQLALDYPPRWASLRGNVLSELKRQRSWLTDLEKVLPEKLVKVKLKLLPQPTPVADSQVSG